MNSPVSNTNHSFDLLRGSAEFMNIILNNISSCILLLDKNMRLKAFNDSLKTIFSNKEKEDLLYWKCGEAIGCAYQIEEGKECGKTSHCSKCELRLAALESYLSDVPVYKKHIQRPFFDYKNVKRNKELQFSTRLFIYNRNKFIIMIIEDITKLVN